MMRGNEYINEYIKLTQLGYAHIKLGSLFMYM